MMANVVAEHLGALTDKQLWFDNPLAVRDARREFRHNRVFYAILTLCIVILVLLAIGARVFYLIYKFERHVPDWLGGNLATGIVILVSGVHFWWVACAAQRRVDGMLMREASLDGMTSLLMLPMSRLRLVLQAAAYPWMAAASVALLLLPIYMFCLGLEGITWAEIVSLYTLFALASVAMPGFRRPALSGSVAATMLNQAIEDPNIEPDSGRSPLRKRGLKAGFGALTLIGIIPAFFVIVALLIGAGRGQIYGALANYVPDTILSLVPSSIISLPFMTARALITPFGFFQWTVFPLPFVAVLVLARKYLNLVRTSEYLSVGTYRDLAALPTYRPRRVAEHAYRITFVLTVVGFLWPWAVRDNGLSFFASNPAARDAGISGMIFLALLLSAACAIVRAGMLGTWMRRSRTPDETQRTIRISSAARYCVTPLLAGIAIVSMCLLLGGDVSLPPQSVQMAGHIIIIAMAAVVMNIGLRRLTGMFGILSYVITAAAVWGPRALRPLIYLSPALGAICQGPRDLFGLSSAAGPLHGASSYWTWAILDTAAGLIMFAAAWIADFVTVRYRTSLVRDESGQDEWDPVYDPTELGGEVFADAGQYRRDSSGQSDSALSLFIVRAVGRCVDNAVATRDLRARLRSRISTPKVVYLSALVLVLSVIIIVWFPFLATLGSGFAESIYGTLAAGSTLQTLTYIQGCFYIAVPIAAFLGGYGVLPRGFGTDKRKNTLSFLLTTPMSAWSIVSGKAFALVLTCGAALWFCTIVSLLFCFPIAVLSGRFIGFGWWAAISGSAFLGYTATAMIMLALGSLFPNLTAVRLNGCIRLVVLYFVYMAVMMIVGLVSAISNYYHVSEQMIWIVCASVAVVLIALSLMITTGAVTGMRKGDIDLKLAKR